MARQLRKSIDFQYLPNLEPIVSEEPNSFFVDNLDFLLKDGTLGKNENAIQRFKAMSEVNALFDVSPKLQETKNVGLLSALTYYQLKSPRMVSSFVRWVEANNIYLIASSNTSDLISIFNRILESRNRTIFVSMPYGKPKSEDHYATIERVAKEVSEANDLNPPLKVERVDWFNDGTSYVITDKINEMLSDCGLLVGNLTYCNPTVYHEIGYVMGKAKAEGKDVANILLFLDESVPKKDRAVAFNLHGLKQLRFNKLEIEFARDLRQHLERFFQMK